MSEQPDVNAPRILTPGHIKSALTCPRQYYYKYIAGYEKNSTPAKVAFANAVRKTLYLSRNEFITGKLVDLIEGTGEEIVIQRFHRNWAELRGAVLSYKDKEDWDKFDDLGAKLLTKWWIEFWTNTPGAMKIAMQDTEVHDVLPELYCSLDNAKYAMGMKAVSSAPALPLVDMVVTEKGFTYLDFTVITSQWGDTHTEYTAHNPYYTACAALYHAIHGKVPDIRITVFKTTKDPKVFYVYTTRTEADCLLYMSSADRIYSLIAYWAEEYGISNEAFYPCNHRRECSWECPYKPLCYGEEDAEEFYKPLDGADDLDDLADDTSASDAGGGKKFEKRF